MFDLLWLLLIPAFAVSDRAVGSDIKHPKTIGNLPALILAVLFGYMGFYASAALCATWLVYRNIPWRVGGTTTPRTAAQVIGSALRHSAPACAAVACFLAGWISGWAVYGFVVYAFSATCLSVYYGLYTDACRQLKIPEDPRANANVELTRGALFGAALAFTTMGHV